MAKLRITEGAQYLQKSALDFFDIIKKGEINYSKEGNGWILIDTDDLDKYKARGLETMVSDVKSEAVLDSEVMALQEKARYLMAFGINPNEKPTSGRDFADKIKYRAEKITQALDLKCDLSSLLIKSNLSELAYGDDCLFDDYLGKLQGLIAEFSNKSALEEQVKSNPFGFSSRYGIASIKKKIYAERKRQAAASAPPAPEALHEYIENADHERAMAEWCARQGFTLDDMIAVVTRGVRAIGGEKVPITGLKKRMGQKFTGNLSKLKSILNGLSATGILMGSQRDAYSINPKSSGLDYPLGQFMNNYLNRRH